MSTAFVDAEAAVVDWLNADGNLCGVGKPLTKGVHYAELRSPGQGTYAMVTRIGGFDDLGDCRTDNARLSFEVYGLTKAGALTGAVALANKLRDLAAARPAVLAGTVRMLTADSLTGPTYVLDGDVPRYLVDCLVLLQPIP